LAKFNEALPVLKMTRLLHAFGKTHPEAIRFALSLVATRLKIRWQLIPRHQGRAEQECRGCRRHALCNCGPDGARPSGRQLSELRVALKDDRVLVAKEILIDIYDAEYALQVRIDGLDQSHWGDPARSPD
jgi:hypothetical protein